MAEQQVNGTRNTWICQMCTLENKATSQMCFACNARRSDKHESGSDNDDDGEAPGVMPAYAHSVPQAPPQRNQPTAHSWSSHKNNNVVSQLPQHAQSPPGMAMTYMQQPQQQQQPIYVVQPQPPTQIVIVQQGKERLLASDTFDVEDAAKPSGITSERERWPTEDELICTASDVIHDGFGDEIVEEPYVAWFAASSFCCS
eukprot:CAMPEP_0197055274 /NCGR_PEP_ID=MMETSP1384-20130603/61432_1 /TAXON_ID=29189 /ORGANISM="Ammonia sp." /LENGTH=199 /DNA_ID=CAMNT_0042488785 /DNA_START=30 /DNA_END=630 /DNA_ORIENTATION=-